MSQANLANANFALAASYWGGYHAGNDLTGADLSQANLTNANFSGYSYPDYDEDGNYLGEVIFPGANLSGANLSGADTRGANFYLATLAGANTTNLIQSDGHIAGLDLTAGASLIVRDYDGNLPIVVDQHLAMDATGTLRLVFDADPWDSTISFAPGIPVALGGTLDLTFAPGVDVATQSGRTIDLFDWTGVTPTGTFTVSSPYTWNLTNLYTTGEVTLTAAAERCPATSTTTAPSTPPTTSSGARPAASTPRPDTTPGAPTSANRPAAAQSPARMPPSPNRQRW